MKPLMKPLPFGIPLGGRGARQRGRGRGLPPLLSRRFFRRCSAEVGEHCLSPKGELRSRPNGVGKIGHSKGGEAGRTFFGSFLCTRKERNWPPGHSRPTPFGYATIGSQGENVVLPQCR